MLIPYFEKYVLEINIDEEQYEAVIDNFLVIFREWSQSI